MLKAIIKKLSNPSGDTKRHRDAAIDLRMLSSHTLRDIGMGR